MCMALGSCAPLAHKGAGGTPSSYSPTDPIRMSPQHMGQGEGVLPGVHVLRHGRDDAPDLGKVTSCMTKQVKLQSHVVSEC